MISWGLECDSMKVVVQIVNLWCYLVFLMLCFCMKYKFFLFSETLNWAWLLDDNNNNWAWLLDDNNNKAWQTQGDFYHKQTRNGCVTPSTNKHQPLILSTIYKLEQPRKLPYTFHKPFQQVCQGHVGQTPYTGKEFYEFKPRYTNLSKEKGHIHTSLAILSFLRQTSTIYLASHSSWRPVVSTSRTMRWTPRAEITLLQHRNFINKYRLL